jgi:hypothetical protein
VAQRLSVRDTQAHTNPNFIAFSTQAIDTT